MATDQLPALQIHHSEAQVPTQAQLLLLLQLLPQLRRSENNRCVEILDALQQEKLARRSERSRYEELELQLKNATVLLEEMNRTNEERSVRCGANADLENEKFARLQLEVTEKLRHKIRYYV
jgi:hypothetical protein